MRYEKEQSTSGDRCNATYFGSVNCIKTSKFVVLKFSLYCFSENDDDILGLWEQDC